MWKILLTKGVVIQVQRKMSAAHGKTTGLRARVGGSSSGRQENSRNILNYWVQLVGPYASLAVGAMNFISRARVLICKENVKVHIRPTGSCSRWRQHAYAAKPISLCCRGCHVSHTCRTAAVSSIQDQSRPNTAPTPSDFLKDEVFTSACPPTSTSVCPPCPRRSPHCSNRNNSPVNSVAALCCCCLLNFVARFLSIGSFRLCLLDKMLAGSAGAFQEIGWPEIAG